MSNVNDNQEIFLVRGLKDFTSGTVAGIAQVIVGHPFNTIKARLQMQPIPPIYSGALDCTKQTILHEGWTGLFKGMASPLVGIGFVNAVSFYVNEEAKRRLSNVSRQDSLNTLDLSLCGAIAGIASSFVSCPVELLMVRLQTQRLLNPNEAIYTGPIDCLKKVVANEGMLSMYKGFRPTFYRELWSYGAYFGVYAAIKRQIIADIDNPSVISSDLSKLFMAGGAAGMAAQLISLPFDAVKVRLQTSIHPVKTSAWTLSKQLLHSDGPGIFFRGFVPVVLRAFPANGAAFVAFELSLKILN